MFSCAYDRSFAKLHFYCAIWAHNQQIPIIIITFV